MRTIKKFWNWIKNEEGRTLYFDGYIAQDSWFDDDITPKSLRKNYLNLMEMLLYGLIHLEEMYSQLAKFTIC